MSSAPSSPRGGLVSSRPAPRRPPCEPRSRCPSFALAYLRLSQAANWTGDEELFKTSIKTALRLRNRLSPRERLRAEAWEMQGTGKLERAEPLYQTLIAQDPTDVEAWFYLAEVLFHEGPLRGRPSSESRDAWERVKLLEPNDAAALSHLARLAARDLDRPAFDSLAARFAARQPSPENLLEIRLIGAFAFGDPAARTSVVESLMK